MGEPPEGKVYKTFHLPEKLDDQLIEYVQKLNEKERKAGIKKRERSSQTSVIEQAIREHLDKNKL